MRHFKLWPFGRFTWAATAHGLTLTPASRLNMEAVRSPTSAVVLSSTPNSAPVKGQSGQRIIQAPSRLITVLTATCSVVGSPMRAGHGQVLARQGKARLARLAE